MFSGTILTRNGKALGREIAVSSQTELKGRKRPRTREFVLSLPMEVKPKFNEVFRILFLSVLRDGFMASVTWWPRLIQIRLPFAKRPGDFL